MEFATIIATYHHVATMEEIAIVQKTAIHTCLEMENVIHTVIILIVFMTMESAIVLQDALPVC